jgi:hypothetical protein
MFQETLEYAKAIKICCIWQSSTLQARVPNGLTWAIAQVIIEILNLVVHPCLLNQHKGH